MIWFFRITFRHDNGEFKTIEVEKIFDPDETLLLSKIFDSIQLEIAKNSDEYGSVWQVEMSRRAA